MKKINIDDKGNNTTILCTLTGLPLAIGYNRIVFGKRGPYIEFDKKHLIPENIKLVEQWRVDSDNAYYIEYRTIDNANVKIYHQSKVVTYADYKIGLFYISPEDLFVNELPVIRKEKDKVKYFFKEEDNV